MKKLFYLLLIFFAPVFASAQQSSPQQTEVMMKMAAFRSSLLGKDVATLSTLLADEVSYGHTNGMVQTKAELLKDLSSGVQQYKSIDPYGMKVRLYGSTAIVTVNSKVNMIYAGNPLDFSMTVLFVWVKSNNQWQLVARQSTKL